MLKRQRPPDVTIVHPRLAGDCIHELVHFPMGSAGPLMLLGWITMWLPSRSISWAQSLKHADIIWGHFTDTLDVRLSLAQTT